jgi:gliding motility-associated-like protein
MKIMKQLLLAPFTILFILLINTPLNATHVSGGNIEYECIGPNQFQITLRLFEDCSGSATLGNNEDIDITSNCGFNQTLTLNRIGPASEISQLCATALPNSSCSGGGLPGMLEYIYQATITFPVGCDSFAYSVADRNSSNNISNSLNEEFSVVATLDNSIPCPNNSPTFSYSGIPYICVGQNVEFNPGVVESDGDSLVYNLVTPLGDNLNPITYNAGFSATQPFGATSPVTFNNTNGQLSFVPDASMANAPGNWVVAIEVCEYRGDSLIGCVTRDFQFVVQNCNNAIPYMIDPGFMNVGNQTTIIDSNSIEVCAGDSFNFQLMFTDSLLGGQPTGDSVISFTNVDAVFPNSNVNVINDDTSIITVNGNIPTTQAGMKSFTVQLEDDACPVPALSILQFDLTVLPKTTITSTSNPDTLCSQTDTTFIEVVGGNQFNWNVLSGEPINPGVNFSDTATVTGNNFWAKPSQTTTYEVVSDNFNGCGNRDTLTVVVSDLITLSPILSDTAICYNDSVELGAFSSSFNSYAWNTGASTPTIFGYGGNNYQVTISDSLGCTSSDTANITNYTQLAFGLPADDTICVSADSFGIGPGNMFDSYIWSTSSTDSSIIVYAPGDYSITATDSNSCTYTDTFSLAHYPDIPYALPGDTIICDYDSLFVDASSLGYESYYWGHIADTASGLYLNSGVYFVSANDTNGCLKTDSILIETSGLVDIVPDTEMICPEDSVQLIADSALLAYNWNTGETTQSIFADTAGIYTVTGTDSIGCQYSDSTDVQFYSVVEVDLGADDTLCLGATVVLDAGPGYNSYNWDDSSNNQVRAVSQSNNYSVTATDQNGCSSSDTINVYFDPGEQFNLGNDTAICPTDSIQLSTPANQQAYSWNTGDTTQSISVQSGTFSVSVTNSRGCTYSDSINISFRTPPTVSLGSDLHYCENTTFSQPVDPGFGFNSYLWYDGTTSQVNNINEQDDTVWVEVTDGFGCVGSDTLLVVEDPTPSLSLGGSDSICAGQSKALNAGTAGGSIVSYQWSLNNQSTQSINISTSSSIINTSNTDYSVTVTDTNGCLNSDTFTLVVSPLPEPDLGNDTAYCVGENFQAVLDPGQFNAYSWNTGASSQSITVGASDSTYSVTVTDANGCSNDDNIRVTENPLPQPNLGADTSICSGVSFNLVLSPGGFEDYNWSTGSANSSILVTQGGNYTVTVTDINGCVNDDTREINIVPSPQIDLGGDRVLCEDSSFTITLDATPALIGPIYNFNWSTSQTTDTIQVDEFGTYSVTVLNSNNGCVDSASVDFIPFGTVEPNLGDDGFICEGEAVVLNPNIESEGYSYTWSTGANTKTINVTEEGTYWVELNAINGTCQGIRDTVTLDRAQQPVVELGDQIRACDGQVVELLNKQTGFPNTEYYWQDTIQSRSITVTTSGTYRVKAVNQCGTITDEISVVFDDCYQIFVPDAFTPNGDGVNDEFKAKTGQDLTEFSMVVYNRWGEVVFKTNDIRVGWNGTMNGNPLPQDSYVWRISYISALDESRTRKEKQGKVIMIK